MAKILVIEDELPMRQRLLETLSYEGFEIICAKNGRLGIEAVTAHRPDLILCDVNMPEMNGYHVLNELRENPETSTIPFIFLTARTSMEDLREGMNKGADDYLTKPFTVDELLRVMKTQLKKHADVSEQASRQIEELSLDLSRTLPHELRTPLQGILSLSEYLLQSGPKIVRESNETKLLEVGTYLHESATRLQRLIENYLLYAELKLLIHDEERKASHTLFREEMLNSHDVIAFFATQKAQEVNREEDLELTLAEIPLRIAVKSLYKLIEEVLDNAFKFSQAGTPIHLMTRMDKQHFVICIQDCGYGMSQEQIAKISAYTQFDRKRHEQQGSGLGLTIVGLLVQMNHGTLTIENAEPHGTTVRVVFDTRRRNASCPTF